MEPSGANVIAPHKKRRLGPESLEKFHFQRGVARDAWEKQKESERQRSQQTRSHQTPKTEENHSFPSIEQLSKAPRFGQNARALILQAAGCVAGPGASASHATFPKRQQRAQKEVKAASDTALSPRLNPTRLLDCVLLQERHFVTYVPRSNIPRVMRQGTADMLMGRYLCHLVGLCLHSLHVDERTEAKASEAVQSDADLRTVARLTTASHEIALYKQVTSKQAYTALSTNAECSLTTLQQHAPYDKLDQLLAKYGNSTEAAFAPPPPTKQPKAAAAHIELNMDLQDLFESSTGSEGVGGCESTNSLSSKASDGEVRGRQPGKGGGDAGEVQQPEGQCGQTSQKGRPTAKQTAVQDSEQQHPEQEVQQDPLQCQGEQQQPHLRGESGAAKSPVLQGQCTDQSGAQLQGLSQGPVDEGHMDELQGSGRQGHGLEEDDEQQRHHVNDDGGQRLYLNDEEEQRHCHRSTDNGNSRECRRRHKSSSEGHHNRQHSNSQKRRPSSSRSRKRRERGAGSGSVADQVMGFVRGLLSPLYKAQLLDKDRFKAVVHKSSQKIMERHQDAQDASFLLYEHEAIRKFVLVMVEATPVG